MLERFLEALARRRDADGTRVDDPVRSCDPLREEWHRRPTEVGRDVVGVELGGALKNVIAIAAGKPGADDVIEEVGVTRDMMDVYGRLTGVRYPWSKYAQVTVADFIGGMENVSATTLVDWLDYNGYQLVTKSARVPDVSSNRRNTSGAPSSTTSP